MRRITLAASGTRGDVQPYIALGEGLKDAGYEVRLLAPENFEGLAADAGLAFRSTGESIEAIIQSEEWRKTTENGNFLSILARMQMELKKRAADIAQKLPELLAGSDLILTGMGGLGGTFSIADMLRIPVIQAYVVPFTATRAFAAPLVPSLPLGPVLNRLSFQVMRQMMWQSSKAADIATRQALGLPRASFFGPYAALERQRTPVLYGYSRHVLPRPDDWASNHEVTGYWFLDAADRWTPPSDLADFLKKGSPPVYIGFGSMVSQDPEEAAMIAVEALKLSGQRGVIAAGWGGMQLSDVSDTVHLIESTPHSWLFPQMLSVVHHGGAGTTAAGLRAGIPSITVPFMGDQPFWGRRVKELSVGPTPIPRKQLTSRRLADAIIETAANGMMRERAEALGRKIAEENGIVRSVEVIGRFIQHRMARN